MAQLRAVAVGNGSTGQVEEAYAGRELAQQQGVVVEGLGMPVAVPRVLVAALAQRTTHNDLLRGQRTVLHGAYGHVAHHRAFQLDVVDEDRLALAVGSLLERPDG